MSELEEFLTSGEQEQVVEAIKKAELNTSGEIRVHFENTLEKACLDRAKEVFVNLDMQDTKNRNGVLFYVAVHDRSFAILGDSGIDKAVPIDFWKSVKDQVISEFSKGNRVGGLVNGILEAGIKLKHYFPYENDDKNELSNEISKS